MTLPTEGRPQISQKIICALAEDQYGLKGTVEPLVGYSDQNFLLDCGQAGNFVVKIANQRESAEVLDFQNEALNWLSETSVSALVPRVLASLSGRSKWRMTAPDGEKHWMRILTYLPGQLMSKVMPRSQKTLENLGQTLGELDQGLADFQHPAMRRQLRWDLRRAERISSFTHYISDTGQRGIVERLLLQYRARVVPQLAELPMSIIHNDANDENVLLSRNSSDDWQVVGIFDFGDMVYTHTINELAIACAYAIFEAESPLRDASHIAAGYHFTRPLTDMEIQVLWPLICIRLCVIVTMAAIAAEEDPLHEYAQISARRAWQTLEQLTTLDWREAEISFREACGLNPLAEQRPWSVSGLLAKRKKLIGPSLSLSYDEPLVIIKGRGQFLFDHKNHAFLDCVNNVSHVGHSHPKVVAELSKQASVLNTNTRYLHPKIVEYAERLTATLPAPLRVCYFVNSGSEANELAVRLARAYTGRKDVIVLEDGYHGNTTTLVEMSPYKCEGPGGNGLASWAHKVSKPDVYRGRYRGTGKDLGMAYAEHVRKCCGRLSSEGQPPALFICESILGCGGQIVLPEGYLREAFRFVRAAGGICAVDEVQVGFGRVGTHMWAFEVQGVIPDIVTLGKPMGNGHPIGAVITTPEISAAFADGMEYFNTFGGNPVSCAIGMAVLDVIDEEGLQEQAARVGQYLVEGFHSLSEKYPLIGDIRGLGLFIGIELVTDREKLTPATKETAALIELLRADGILLSAEGPHHNVLKIKPPLQFQQTDADLLLGAVDRALSEICRSTTSN